MLYFLLKHDIVRTSTQMLPAYLALLILNAAFSLLFSHLCLLWTWPAGLLSPSFTPWTNSSMSDGFSLHHASLRSHSFTRHLRGFKDQKKKKEKEKQLAMSRRFFKSPAHHAEKTRLWEVINLWHAYKVVFVQGTTVNIFVLLCFFPLWVRVTPAAPRTAPFAGCCYSGQHPRQFPGVPGEAQLPQEEIRTVCTVVRNKTPCKFLSLKFAIIRSCSC